MKENNFRFWEIITKIFASILVLIGIIITIVHFNSSQNNQLRIVEKQIESQREENKELNRNDFQNSFWNKQLELYVQASSFAAELTQFELSSSDYLKSRVKFYTLFWGPMSIVEDIAVKKHMENFSTQLIKYEKSKSDKDLNKLKQMSFQLAKACRESSIKRWDLKEFEME
jgi:hypothetical protein